MEVFLVSLINFTILMLQIYTYIIFANIIMSWLLIFGVINLKNQYVYRLERILNRMTAPVYEPVRRFLPDLNGIDLSPIVIIFGIYLIQSILANFGERLLA